MIIDLKYHLASLVAVFLALGIGILIGTTMIGNDVILNQQKRLITSLQEEFVSLRDENRKVGVTIAAMQEEAAYQQQFNRAVLPVLVQGKLQGRQIAIIDLNYAKEHDSLINILRMAGADIQSSTVLNLEMLKNPDISKQLSLFFGKEKEVSPDKYLPDLARFLVSSILIGGNEDIISYLDQKEVLRISGSYGAPLHDTIIIGGINNKDQDYAKIFDLELIKTLQQNDIKIFGVEDSKVLISYMRYYQSARITTVDNIDTIFGQIALVQAMWDQPGNYGIKQTADAFMPPLKP